MKRCTYILLAVLLALTGLAGCQPKRIETSYIADDSSSEALSTYTRIPGGSNLPEDSSTSTNEASVPGTSSGTTWGKGTGGTTSVKGSTSSQTTQKQSQNAGESSTAPTTAGSPTTTPPAPMQNGEMKGVWVSFLELNTMFSGKSVAQAKMSIDTMMSNIKSYGLNTVIFHVRDRSNAYYASSVFDSAASVKGLLNAGFDPLSYAVSSAHANGLALHAWINPYRVGSSLSYAKCSDTFKSGSTYWYNPASSEAQALIINGVKEVVDNYAVDGVQFDDYFYPTDTSVVPVSSPASFETAAYGEYTSAGGQMSIGEWRRTQVSLLVSSVYKIVENIRQKRVNCVFGISPAADAQKDYSTMYADVASWMAKPGYIDYICPQIYYGFDNSTSPFQSKLNSWAAMSRLSSVKLYVGLALYKTGWESDAYAGTGKTEWANHNDILARQFAAIRAKSECSGMMLYRYDAFDPNNASARDSKPYSVATAQKEIENLLAVLR